MIPTLLELGPIKLHTYGLCLALGLICGHWLLTLELRRRRLPESFAGLEITLAAVFGIVGSKIFDVLEHPGRFAENPLRLFSGSGLTWYGGFILATLAIWVAARYKRLPWWQVVECSTPGLAIGYGFGRLGCFLSGDGCYGLPCSAGLPFPLCMSFPHGIVPTTELVYNTPIWEITGAILTFSYIWAVRRRVVRVPGLFLRFLIVHGVLRFLVELVRHNPKLIGVLSQAQVISIAIVLAGIAGLIYLARQPAPAPLPAAAGAASPAGESRPRQPARGGRKGKGRRR